MQRSLCLFIFFCFFFYRVTNDKIKKNKIKENRTRTVVACAKMKFEEWGRNVSFFFNWGIYSVTLISTRSDIEKTTCAIGFSYRCRCMMNSFFSAPWWCRVNVYDNTSCNNWTISITRLYTWESCYWIYCSLHSAKNNNNILTYVE